MAHYQIQLRRLVHLAGESPSFPSTRTTAITFGPEDAFGCPPPVHQCRETVKLDTRARIGWNANEGVSSLDGEIIEPLSMARSFGEIDATLYGNVLSLTRQVLSIEDAIEQVNSESQLLPFFLSLRLGVFVWIKDFRVSIGTSSFYAPLYDQRSHAKVTTSEINAECAMKAVQDLQLCTADSLRLILSISYFRHAQRLAIIQPHSESMTGEVVLNLAKAIEILFSSDRDTLRARATDWELDKDFIERWIVPILLIRNELDVAHVGAAPLNAAQREAILEFGSRAVEIVGDLLQQLIDSHEGGKISFAPISDVLDSQKVRLLERIAEYMRP